jgi:hypothetical protein
MKYTVLLDEFEEREIRPPELYDEYEAIVAEELTRLAAQPDAWETSPCPACDARATAPAFRKSSLQYNHCERCGTLYVSPRPSSRALASFRETSAGERFWLERVVPPTAASRGRYVSGPRVDWVLDNAAALDVRPRWYLHVGPAYDAVPEELARRGVLDRIIAVSPPPPVAGVADPGIERVHDAGVAAFGRLGGRAALAAIFEMLQGHSSPAALLTAVRGALMPGGRVLITTVSWDGFETQMLRERARGIGLHSHINLFTLEGITELVRRTGFRLLELSTPGRLDAKLVAEAFKADPALPLSRFIQRIVCHPEPAVLQQFQEFLQTARLSSHLRVVAEAV